MTEKMKRLLEAYEIEMLAYNLAVKVINIILEKKQLSENKEKSIDELFEEFKLETNFEFNFLAVKADFLI